MVPECNRLQSPSCPSAAAPRAIKQPRAVPRAPAWVMLPACVCACTPSEPCLSVSFPCGWLQWLCICLLGVGVPRAIGTHVSQYVSAMNGGSSLTPFSFWFLLNLPQFEFLDFSQHLRHNHSLRGTLSKITKLRWARQREECEWLHKRMLLPRLCKTRTRVCVVWSLFKLITIITFCFYQKPPIEIVQLENKRDFRNSGVSIASLKTFGSIM